MELGSTSTYEKHALILERTLLVRLFEIRSYSVK